MSESHFTVMTIFLCALFATAILQGQPSMALPTSTVPATGVAINDSGAAPNANAALDVSSPATGNGKGLLVPRITLAQRTTADDNLAGGLITSAGLLRGGAAPGLLVYQTDGTQGFYYNVSATAIPDWKFLGAGTLATQNADAVAITGGTIAGATVTTPTLSGGTITNTAITGGSLTTATVTNPTLSGGSITSSAISGGTVSNATVAGGSIDSAPIGATTPAAVTATTLKSTGTAEVQGAQITLGKAATAAPGKLVLHDNDAATSTATTLQSAATVGSDFTLTLPSGPGLANQVLRTDGAGNLSWSTPIVATGDFKADGTVAMTGDLSLGTKSLTNVHSITFTSEAVTVGTGALASSYGTSVGRNANSVVGGTAIGYMANGNDYNVAVGYMCNGYAGNGSSYVGSVAVGYKANGRSGDGNYSGSVVVGYVANGFVGNGANSGSVAIGYSANARNNVNEDYAGAVAIGFQANSYIKGAGVGYCANSYNQGAALGYKSFALNQGTCVGYLSNGYVNGTALGYRANSGNQNFSFAKGPYSQCIRHNEEWKGADTLSEGATPGYLDGYNKFGYGQVNFNGTTTNNLLTELFLGGTFGKRFLLKDNSALTFQIIITAVNTVTGDTSGWIMQGVIKRRFGAATTYIIPSIVTTLASESGGLTTDPTITADTTNGSLKLSVTGVSANSVKWNAAMSYSEVRE